MGIRLDSGHDPTRANSMPSASSWRRFQSAAGTWFAGCASSCAGVMPFCISEDTIVAGVYPAPPWGRWRLLDSRDEFGDPPICWW